MSFIADVLFVGISSFFSALFSAPIAILTDLLTAWATALVS